MAKESKIPFVVWIGIIVSGILSLSLFVWALLIKFGIL